MKKTDLTSKDLIKYEGNYSEGAFWDKVKKIASKAGAKTIYYALVLYYTLMDPATPSRYKAVIMGALGYMILPYDLLPDIIPFAGLADDWAALVAAVAYVASAITPEIKEKARAKVNSWFGHVDDSSLGDLA
ncbi:MAG: DUF1232 domain-containing protein [Bacteroidales bacterium]|nr:DUF1232 domain-containing protein [Bacteroidales bacterium]